MGNTRTPRPVYFDHGVVEFFVRNKIVNYRTVIWNKNGTSQFILETGLYNNNSDEIVKKAQQTFVTVSKN